MSSVCEIPSEIVVRRAERTPMSSSQELLNQAENNPDLLNKVITCDESWVYGCAPATKAQSSQWKSPGSLQLKKVCQNRLKENTMMLI